MFSDDKNIESLEQLFIDLKKYIMLQKEYSKLEIVEKLTILSSAAIVALLLTVLGMMALFYLLFALAYVLEPIVGGLKISFTIIAAINILIILFLVAFRKKLIINPLANFLANLFLTDSKKEKL